MVEVLALGVLAVVLVDWTNGHMSYQFDSLILVPEGSTRKCNISAWGWWVAPGAGEPQGSWVLWRKRHQGSRQGEQRANTGFAEAAFQRPSGRKWGPFVKSQEVSQGG